MSSHLKVKCKATRQPLINRFRKVQRTMEERKLAAKKDDLFDFFEHTLV